MNFILNAPIWLIAILTVLGIAILFSGLRSGQENLRRTAFIIFIAAAALLVLKWSVPTDEKKVEKSTRELLAAIGSGDWAKAGPMLSRAALWDWHGEALAHAAKSNAEGYGLTEIKINSLDVKRESNVLTVRAAVTTHHHAQDFDSVPSTWDFQYQKRSGNWVLLQIIPIRLGMSDALNDQQAILRDRVR